MNTVIYDDQSRLAFHGVVSRHSFAPLTGKRKAVCCSQHAELAKGSFAVNTRPSILTCAPTKDRRCQLKVLSLPTTTNSMSIPEFGVVMTPPCSTCSSDSSSSDGMPVMTPHSTLSTHTSTGQAPCYWSVVQQTLDLVGEAFEDVAASLRVVQFGLYADCTVPIKEVATRVKVALDRWAGSAEQILTLARPASQSAGYQSTTTAVLVAAGTLSREEAESDVGACSERRLVSYPSRNDLVDYLRNIATMCAKVHCPCELAAAMKMTSMDAQISQLQVLAEAHYQAYREAISCNSTASNRIYGNLPAEAQAAVREAIEALSRPARTIDAMRLVTTPSMDRQALLPSPMQSEGSSAGETDLWGYSAVGTPYR